MKLSSFSLAYAFVVASSGPLLPLAGVHGQSTAPALRRSAVGDEGGRSRRLYSSWYGGSGKGSGSSGKGKGHSGKGSSSSGKGHSGKGSGHSGKGKGDGGSSGLTSSPTSGPTSSPTGSPTSAPTSSPTGSPTSEPTSSPTGSPSSSPTGSPTSAPTSSPTGSPTSSPTSLPTGSPTSAPMPSLTGSPTDLPTICGTTLTGDNVLEDDVECAVANGESTTYDCTLSSICLSDGAFLDCSGKTISMAVNASIKRGVFMPANSTLVNCTVTGFGSDGGFEDQGIFVRSSSGTGATLTSVFANNNLGDGIFVTGSGISTLTEVVANNNTRNGISGSATGVNLMNIVTNDNGEDGLDFVGAKFSMTTVVTNAVAKNNGRNGMTFTKATATPFTVSFDRIEACQNGGKINGVLFPDIRIAGASLNGSVATYGTCFDDGSGQCPLPRTDC